MGPLKWLAVATAALSLVSLYQDGFEAPPLAPFLQAIVDADGDLKLLIFKWLEPVLQGLLQSLAEWSGWTVSLHASWKHIVVLLWLYFGGAARLAWVQNDRPGAIFRIAWGSLLGLSAGVAFGLVPTEPNAAQALAAHLSDAGLRLGGRVGLGFLSVLFPVAAIVLFVLGIAAWIGIRFDRGRSSWSEVFFRYAAAYPVLYGYFGFAIVIAAILLNLAPPLHPTFELLPNPGLILLLLLIMGLAVFLRWSDRLLPKDNNLGIAMLHSIYGAIVFLLVDASWKIVAS